jgi:hypothetical protein
MNKCLHKSPAARGDRCEIIVSFHQANDCTFARHSIQEAMHFVEIRRILKKNNKFWPEEAG